VCLWLTALRDEAECRAHFGEAYVRYMAHTKRFVPWVL
jgi:protein-S-isoprenylcysteine O-methyltransferase Ste14